MGMQMWLSRPREFEKLDQAINDACCEGEEGLARLQQWADKLHDVVTGGGRGIGSAGDTGAYPTPAASPLLAQDHFYRHWVGDYAARKPPQPPLYWPYAWGRHPYPPSERLLIDRLISFGLQWSILKVKASHGIDPDDESNAPACSKCRKHVTVWVCYEVTEDQKLHAAADLDYRRKLFRVGVIESRDAVVLVINTPRPIELTGGVCDDTKEHSDGEERLFKEPVIVTSGFVDGENPRWTQPVNAETALGAGHLVEVEDQELPGGGFMPAGTYPPNVEVDPCVFVPLPVSAEGISEATPSDFIKAVLTRANEPGVLFDEGLKLSPGLIERLRISIDDEAPPRAEEE